MREAHSSEQGIGRRSCSIECPTRISICIWPSLLDLNLGLWRISSSSFGCRMVVLQSVRTRTSNGSQIIRAPSTDLTALSKTNETIHGVHLDAGLLGNTTTVIVEVRARHVGIGNQTGTLGVDGDRVGFALAVRGAYRDARPPADTDGDGVPDTEDPCPSHPGTTSMRMGAQMISTRMASSTRSMLAPACQVASWT